MAAVANVNVIASVDGLGKRQEFFDRADDGTTPTAATYNYRTIAVADTAEALDLGDVAVETLLIIKAISFDVDVDLDYVSTFDADFTIKAGEPAAVIPNPSGIIYWKNNGAAEAAKIEYLLTGTT